MRTTLDIDKDVLDAAKELARRQNLSTGQVVSRMLRKALTGQNSQPEAQPAADSSAPTVAGFRPFTGGKAVVSNDAVNRLRDTEAL